MSKPTKRNLARQERLAELRKQTEGQSIEVNTEKPSSPTRPAPSPAPRPEPSTVASGRAKGAGVSQIISSMKGGVMGELHEAQTERDRLAAELEQSRAVTQDLRMRMEAIAQGGEAGAQLLDTETLRLTTFDNRDPKSFDDDDRDFQDLKADIEAQQGNLIPGLVRPLEEPEGKVLYEVVYGNRRMMACRRAGLKFKAFIQTISDEDAMLLQHVENAHRKNLSAIETAQKVQSFLKRHRGDSGRVEHGALALLSETLKLNKQYVSRLSLIGQIPDRVIEAIPDIREIPFRPAHQLAKASRDSESEVLARLDGIDPTWKSRKVVNHLLGSSTSPKPTAEPSAAQAMHFVLPQDATAQAEFNKELRALAKRFGVTLQRLEPGRDEPT